MSIHIKGAEEIALKILGKYYPRRYILHWYTGNLELQKDFIYLGCYFFGKCKYGKKYGCCKCNSER